MIAILKNFYVKFAHWAMNIGWRPRGGDSVYTLFIGKRGLGLMRNIEGPELTAWDIWQLGSRHPQPFWFWHPMHWEDVA